MKILVHTSDKEKMNFINLEGFEIYIYGKKWDLRDFENFGIRSSIIRYRQHDSIVCDIVADCKTTGKLIEICRVDSINDAKDIIREIINHMSDIYEVIQNKKILPTSLKHIKNYCAAINGNCKKCAIIKYSKYTCAGCYRRDFKPMNWELRKDV